MGRGRLTAMAVVALAGVLITGCGTKTPEAQPKAWASGEQTEKTGSTPRSAPPSTAPALDELGFVKKYVDAINTSRTTGDGAAMLEFATSSCRACSFMAGFNKKLYATGGKFVGDPSWEVTGVAQQLEGSDPVTITVTVEEATVDLIKKKGATAQKLVGGGSQQAFELVRDGGAWKVDEFCEVSEGSPPGCPS